MTLGLSNGTKLAGLALQPGDGLITSGNGNVAIGTTGQSTNTTGFTSGQAIGLTTNPAKSGIITESHSHTLTTLQCGTYIIKYA